MESKVKCESRFNKEKKKHNTKSDPRNRDYIRVLYRDGIQAYEHYSSFSFVDYDGSLLGLMEEDIDRGILRPGRLLYNTENFIYVDPPEFQKCVFIDFETCDKKEIIYSDDDN